MRNRFSESLFVGGLMVLVSCGAREDSLQTVAVTPASEEAAPAPGPGPEGGATTLTIPISELPGTVGLPSPLTDLPGLEGAELVASGVSEAGPESVTPSPLGGEVSEGAALPAPALATESGPMLPVEEGGVILPRGVPNIAASLPNLGDGQWILEEINEYPPGHAGPNAGPDAAGPSNTIHINHPVDHVDTPPQSAAAAPAKAGEKPVYAVTRELPPEAGPKGPCCGEKKN